MAKYACKTMNGRFYYNISISINSLIFDHKILKIKKNKKLKCLMKINAILEILQSCHKDHKTNQQLYCLYVCCLYEL